MKYLPVDDRILKIVQDVRENSIPYAENLPLKIVRELADALLQGELLDDAEVAARLKEKCT